MSANPLKKAQLLERIEKIEERFDALKYAQVDANQAKTSDRENLKKMDNRIEALEDIIIVTKMREDLYRRRYELTCERLVILEHYLPDLLRQVYKSDPNNTVADLSKKIDDQQAKARLL